MAKEIPFIVYKNLARAILNEVVEREEEKFIFDYEQEPFYFQVKVKVDCDYYESTSGNIDFTWNDYDFDVEICCFTLETEDDFIQEDCFFNKDKYNEAVDDNILDDYYAKLLRKSVQVLCYNPVAELDSIIKSTFKKDSCAS